MNASISVIICIYTDRRKNIFYEAVQSILPQLKNGDELLVVVDHNDILLESISDLKSHAKVVPNSNARGLSGARNTGVAAARGQICAFVDDDAVASEGWLDALRNAFDDGRIVGMGGQVTPHWPVTAPRWLPQPFLWVVGCSSGARPAAGQRPRIRNPIGCNMAFRTDALKLAGGFQTSLGRLGDNAAGAEETELSLRLSRLLPRMDIVFDGGCEVVHHIEEHRTVWRYFLKRCFAEGKSKAVMQARAGSRGVLAEETAYVRKTLPVYVLRSLAELVRSGDGYALVRAANVFCGLSAAAAGYATATLRRAAASPARFSGYKVIDLDIGTLPDRIDLRRRDGVPYEGIFALVRQNGRAIGTVELPVRGDAIADSQLQIAIAGQVEDSRVVEDHAAGVAGRGPLVSVIIATRNRADSLKRTISSVLAQTYGNFEIVVVDNAPSDQTTHDLVLGYTPQSSRIHYVLEPLAGLGRAHNAGVQQAQGQILAFTDDDVVVDANWLQAIVDVFAEAEGIGCVTGLILPAELETRAQIWTERHGGFGKGFRRRTFDLGSFRDPDPLYPFAAGRFGSGANMAFRAAALKQIQGFDNALGAGTIARGGDDIDAFLRLIVARHQLVYAPDAILWHYHRREESGMSRQALGYGIGLGAYLCKQIMANPRNLLTFAAALPWAVAHIFSRSSSKNARLPEDYPAMLRWRERWGILLGFPAYLRSRKAAR